MKLIILLMACLVVSSACAPDPPSPAQEASSPLRGVVVYGNCTSAEQAKLQAAVDILVEITGTQYDPYGPRYSEYEACLSSATFVENPHGHTGAQIADALTTNKATGIWCWNLPAGQIGYAVEKPNNDEEVYFSKAFLPLLSTRRVAAIIGHELMHNRGFDHDQNPLGSPLGLLTVNEQVEACIYDGFPNRDPRVPTGFAPVADQSDDRGAVNDYQHYFADVNGDGNTDWIQVHRTSNSGHVGLGNGNGTFNHWSNHSVHRGAVNDYEHYFADVDGDGRADWIQVARMSDNGWVGLANANGDGNFQHWTNHSFARGAVNNFEHYFADVNGDGKADWIQVSRTSNIGSVGLANANGDGNFQHWSNHSFARGAVINFKHYFADVNGDGKADWIQVDRTSDNGWVGLANANGDGNFQHWTNHSTQRGAANNFEHNFADVNGDGKADWIQVHKTSNNGWVALANPSGDGTFVHWSNWSPDRGAVNDFQHYFADVNGDAKADWIQIDRNSNNGWVGLASSTIDGWFDYWTFSATDFGAVANYEHYFVDVTADGRADWIRVSRTANTGWVRVAVP